MENRTTHKHRYFIGDMVSINLFVVLWMISGPCIPLCALPSIFFKRKQQKIMGNQDLNCLNTLKHNYNFHFKYRYGNKTVAIICHWFIIMLAITQTMRITMKMSMNMAITMKMTLIITTMNIRKHRQNNKDVTAVEYKFSLTFEIF